MNRTTSTILLALVASLALGGCKRTFSPGAYDLVSVLQEAVSPDGETNASELRVTGTAGWVFDADGTFLVKYDGYGVNFEKACSGTWSGTWQVTETELTMTVTRVSVPGFCAPERERVYTWDRGWGGALTLRREWDENASIVYRLDPKD